MVTRYLRYASNMGLDVVDLTVILSGLHGAWSHGTLSKRSSRIKGLKAQRPQCWAEFHGRRPHDGGCDHDGNGGNGTRNNEMNNLRFPEGGHRRLVAHFQVSIILISLQRADHDHVYCCSPQGRHREP
jgi:hypothetical protein